METAEQVGVILQGKVQSYKLFPNGNQINVTIRTKGDIIGPAAAFSVQRKYPFGVIALEETKVLMFRRGDYLHLLQSDPRLVENAFSEIATIRHRNHPDPFCSFGRRDVKSLFSAIAIPACVNQIVVNTDLALFKIKILPP